MTPTTEGIALADELRNTARLYVNKSDGLYNNLNRAADMLVGACAEQAAHEATRAKLAASDADWAQIDQISVANGWSQHIMDFGMNEAAAIAASHRPGPEVDVLVEVFDAIARKKVRSGTPWSVDMASNLRAELAKRGHIVAAGGGV